MLSKDRLKNFDDWFKIFLGKMVKTARSRSSKGFTLIEFFIAMGIIAILLGLATPYLFGAKEKASLELERDKIVNTLKTAQQKAIAAYQGYNYIVEFDEHNNQYTLKAEGDSFSQTTILPSQIKSISALPTNNITFEKLTGLPTSNLNITLHSKRFKSEIEVNAKGLITTTNPEKI